MKNRKNEIRAVVAFAASAASQAKPKKRSRSYYDDSSDAAIETDANKRRKQDISTDEFSAANQNKQRGVKRQLIEGDIQSTSTTKKQKLETTPTSQSVAAVVIKNKKEVPASSSHEQYPGSFIPFHQQQTSNSFHNDLFDYNVFSDNGSIQQYGEEQLKTVADLGDIEFDQGRNVSDEMTIKDVELEDNTDISIDNVISTADFQCTFNNDDMYLINSECWNVTWNETKNRPHVKGTPGNALTIGIRDETRGRNIRASVTVYKSGKVVCRGAKSVADSERAIRICGRHIQKVLGKGGKHRTGTGSNQRLREIQVHKFKVVNIAAHFVKKENFDMKGVSDQLKEGANRHIKVEWPCENPNNETDGLETAKYSEKNIQGLKSKRKQIQATTAMVHKYGFVSIMGAKDIDTLYRICNKIKNAIQQNLVLNE